MDKYPEYVMKAVRQRQWLDEDDTEMDNEIVEMSKAEVFDELIAWHIGEGNSNAIRMWVRDVYGVFLD